MNIPSQALDWCETEYSRGGLNVAVIGFLGGGLGSDDAGREGLAGTGTAIGGGEGEQRTSGEDGGGLVNGGLGRVGGGRDKGEELAKELPMTK